MGWLIAFGIIVLLAVFPLGISLKYQQLGLMVWIQIGPVRIRVYPAKEKQREHDGPTQQQTSKLKGAMSKKKAQVQEEAGGSWIDFLPLLDVAWDFLGDLRRKIRVRDLKLHVTLAGDDPCDLAINYGRMNGALAGLLAQLQHLFSIRRQSVQLRCDFDAEQTVVTAGLDLTITVGRAVCLLVRHGMRGMKTYFSIKKQQEGGAEL